jgi:F-type H+-transporting ATPase subunit c
MDVGSAKFIAVGVASLSFIGVGLGLGTFFASVMKAMSRNPAAKKDFSVTAFIYFALIESVALLGFVVILLLLFS